VLKVDLRLNPARRWERAAEAADEARPVKQIVGALGARGVFLGGLLSHRRAIVTGLLVGP
jgi:hypothetical protein